MIREAERRIRSRFPSFIEEFEALLDSLDYELAPVPTPEEVSANAGLVRQKNDIPVALSIIATGIDHFVTYDRDFTDHDETTNQIRQALPGIMLPPVFLRDIMGWTSEELEAIRHRERSDIQEE